MGDRQAIARAAALLASGRPEQALKLLTDAPDDDGDTWYYRSSALYSLDREEEAVAAAREGLKRAPHDDDLFDALARPLIELDRLHEAEHAVLSAIRLNPRNAHHWCVYARMCGLAGQEEKADALLAEALRLDPELLHAAETRLSLAWLRYDDVAVAEASRQVLALDPQSQAGHAMLGVATALSGRPDEAAENMRAAVLVDPSARAIVATADQVRIQAHPLLRPVRLLHWVGGANSWIFFLAVTWLLVGLGYSTLGLVIIGSYLALVVYSWAAHTYVERRIRDL